MNAPAVAATPLIKSRRVILRCIPSSRSRESCTIFSQTSRSVENERHKQNYEPLSSAFFTASSAPWNPILLWVPSQKGLLTEPPHRHRENAVLPVRSN